MLEVIISTTVSVALTCGFVALLRWAYNEWIDSE